MKNAITTSINWPELENVSEGLNGVIYKNWRIRRGTEREGEKDTYGQIEMHYNF